VTDPTTGCTGPGSPCTSLLADLRRCPEGSAVSEFALTAPIFLVMLMGLVDVAQMVYGQAVLNGAVQQAARISSLENGDTNAADQMVRSIVSRVLANPTITSTRNSYFDFTDIGRPERYNDTDGDGQCDNSEAYTDENGNGQWDSEIGIDGNGGSGDVVVYTVTASYRPAVKIPFMPNNWGLTLLSSSTIRKNQPFATQQTYSSAARTCN
jgi:Flp pilus assembly protein TadG